MATLGCPEDYQAVLVNSRTQLPLMYLPWSSITWQRTKNEVSVASVVVPEGDAAIQCASIIRYLFGWSQMLRVERNGEAVWDGPVTGWNRPPGSHSVTIKAHDRSALFFKRLLRVRRTLTNVTPYSLIRQVITDANIGNIAYDPYPVTLATATPPSERVTRDYFVERMERIYDVVREVTENTTSGFWTTQAESIYFDELTIADLLGRAYAGKAPKISDLTTLGPPGIDVDCLGMATVTYAGGAGQGVNGFPLIVSNNGNLNLFLTSTLEKASAEDRAVTDLSLIAGRAAAEALTPATTIEKIPLAPDFGSEFMLANLSNLMPGAQFDVDYEETSAMHIPISEYRETAGTPGVAYAVEIPALRMDQLDVTVTKDADGGIHELVQASCRPILFSVDLTKPTGNQSSVVLGTDRPAPPADATNDPPISDGPIGSP